MLLELQLAFDAGKAVCGVALEYNANVKQRSHCQVVLKCCWCSDCEHNAFLFGVLILGPKGHILTSFLAMRCHICSLLNTWTCRDDTI